jgi:hypothetical protein
MKLDDINDDRFNNLRMKHIELTEALGMSYIDKTTRVQGYKKEITKKTTKSTK